MNKPITVEQLKEYCEEEIKKGNADKIIMISDDEEGNGFHYLWYSFCDVEDSTCDDYMIDERIASKENTIILG